MSKTIEQIKQEIKDKEKELAAAIKNKERELAAAIKAAKADGVAAVKELVARHQLSYNDVKHLFKDAAKSPRRTMKAKYRLKTSNGVVEWAGVGRQPRAIVEYIQNGGRLEDIAI